MKMWAIAFKDVRRAFLNAFLLVFGFVFPFLTAGLFYFAFGGLSDDGGFQLAIIPVRVANLDQTSAEYGNFSAGELMVEFLESEEMADLVEVRRDDDAAAARTAVDNQTASVAVIIPADFTAAVFDPEGRAAVEVYSDPTLTLAPDIVESIVGRIVDGFAGTKIAANVASEQLAEAGVAVDTQLAQEIAMEYAAWSTALGEEGQEGTTSLADVRPPSGEVEEEAAGDIAVVIGLIMAGMMTFYTFFTGAASAQTILQEEEEGTLPRLFTTPTSHSTILGGKAIATLITLLVQVGVLVILSSVIFGIDWGEPLPVALAGLGLVVSAAGFGIFIISLLESSQQAGVVMGGVMTMLGMIGMASTFTAGVPNISDVAETISLFTPQGWAVRAWSILLRGGELNDVLLTAGVLLALGSAFFVIGVLRFRKRYA